MLKRTFLVGLGLLNWSRERVREATEDLVARGHVEASRRDGLVADVLDAIDRRTPLVDRRAQPGVRFRRRIGQAIDALPLATKDDLKALEERLRTELVPKERGGSGPS